jgi:hypothetical protein
MYVMAHFCLDRDDETNIVIRLSALLPTTGSTKSSVKLVAPVRAPSAAVDAVEVITEDVAVAMDVAEDVARDVVTRQRAAQDEVASRRESAVFTLPAALPVRVSTSSLDLGEATGRAFTGGSGKNWKQLIFSRKPILATTSLMQNEAGKGCGDGAIKNAFGSL